ncbi:MAG TPA: hypothetical protein ENI23_15040 [bacterium]|nr:hypothetical protein [bacterium]
MNEHTPTPWKIQNHPADPTEFYLAGQKTEDHPYYNSTSYPPEILSDEDYPRKRADAERIVACINAMEGIADPEKFMSQFKEPIFSKKEKI